MTDLADLQTAVRQVPGVATAVVRWPEPQGPAQLRVEFAAGADRRAVTESVVRTMVEVGDIDLATMRVEGETGEPVREGRPVFTTLSLDRVGQHLAVEVTLATRERSHVGRHAVDLDGHDVLALVARAAVAAVNSFAGGEEAYRFGRADRLGIDGARDEQVTVQVEVDGEVLLGAALVRGDAREATVRATLDAINRHVIKLPE